MTNEKVKVAVLSMTGQNSSYAQAFHSNPNAEIVAVIEDETPPATARANSEETQQGNKEAAKQFGVPFVERLDDVLAREDVQVVTFSSPFERRAALVEKIASAGKHVFVDKPVTNNLADADAVLESVRRHRVKLMAGHNYTFNPAILKARDLLKAGDVGLPWAIHSEWVIAAGRQAAPIGELMNHAMYPLDALLYLVPEKVKTVYAISGAYFFENAKANKTEDLAFITMNMERGVIATTSLGRTPIPHMNGYGGDRTIRIMGTHGMLYLDTNRPGWISYGKSGTRNVPYGADQTYDMIDHFIDCVRHDRENMCGPQYARDTLEIILAARKSAEDNAVVNLPLGG